MHPTRWLVFASLGLLVFSLFLPAIEGPGFPTQSGLDILRSGAGAWRDGVFAWYANPVLVAALILIRFDRYLSGLALAVTGLALALSSFGAGAMAEASGRQVPAFGFAIGFYIWLVAFVLAILAAGAGIYKVYKAR